MQIANIVAGYSLGEADLLRRAMGKKKAEEMAAQREKFVNGAQAEGIQGREEESRGMFDLMEQFAGYGFNKSHSAAYAVLAYRTAYLKAHYPQYFMAAILTSERGSQEKVVKYINECREMGIAILPPDVNHQRCVLHAHSERHPIRPDGNQECRRERPSPRSSPDKPFKSHLRFLRTRGSAGGQQTRGGKPDQGRRVRQRRSRPSVALYQRRSRHGMGTAQAARKGSRAGRPVRHDVRRRQTRRTTSWIRPSHGRKD